VLTLRGLYAFVPIDNVSSCSLFRSEGFVEVGTLSDWFFFAGNYRDAQLFQKKLP